MSSGEKIDQAKTYVLDETAFTKAKTIEELAELAADAVEDQGGGQASIEDGQDRSKD